MKRFLTFLLPCLLLGACLTEPKQCPVNPSNPATETFAASLGVNLDSMVKTQIGDYTQDLVVGTGQLLDSLQTVQIHYTAYLVNGTLIDQVVNEPFPIDLSTTATVGLADGMLGMQVGGTRLIVAPSTNALGACANGPVPGNSTLVYRVDLLQIGI
jgi:FKBP-type peptidyl-prolyl cis-trans isomerase FkpA